MASRELKSNFNLAMQLEMNRETVVLEPASRTSGTRYFGVQDTFF